MDSVEVVFKTLVYLALGSIVFYGIIKLGKLLVKERERRMSFFLKDGFNRMRGWSLRAKIGLAFTVVVLIAVTIGTTLFYSNAKLNFKAVNWHVMGEEAHMSFRMFPSDFKTQSLKLMFWLPTGLGQPVDVTVSLGQEGKGGIPNNVSFKLISAGPDPYGFEGFDKYTYDADAAIITELGEWVIKIQVTDPLGQVHTYEKTLAISDED